MRSTVLRMVTVAVALAAVAGVAGPASADHDTSCAGTPFLVQEPPSTFNPNPQITYGGTVSCTNVKRWVEIAILLFDTELWTTVDSREVRRNNSSGFTLTDTYQPNVCGSLNLGTTRTYEVDLFWRWENSNGSTAADHERISYDMVCPLIAP